MPPRPTAQDELLSMLEGQLERAPLTALGALASASAGYIVGYGLDQAWDARGDFVDGAKDLFGF